VKWNGFNVLVMCCTQCYCYTNVHILTCTSAG